MRILVSAYACEPGQGSEPGVGWNWARELAREHDVWVLTRANNREQIEAAVVAHPDPRLRFLYLDLPPWIRRWKRGQRGIHAYAYAWQLAARRVVRDAHRSYRFDLVHHVTFASAFIPARTWLSDVPFVWGPVGGGIRVPWRLVPEGGPRAVLYETLRAARRFVSRYGDPLVRSTWRHADLILVQNAETLSWLPRKHRGKARLHPNAGIDASEIRASPRGHDDSLVAIAAGRLVHLKAFSLAIRALAKLRDPRIRLIVAGDGPERARLERLVERLALSERVEFLGQIPNQQLLERFAGADVLLFPSLHEECGFVVVEAMARGAVPIVLDIGGPAALVGSAGHLVPARGRSRLEVIDGLADALSSTRDPVARARLSGAAVERARSFSWSTKPAALDTQLFGYLEIATGVTR